MGQRGGYYAECKYGRLAIPYSKMVCSQDDTKRIDPETCMNHYNLIEKLAQEKPTRNKMEGQGQ